MAVDTEWLIKTLGAGGGAIGTLLGIYNFLHARMKEREAKMEEENDFNLLAAVMDAHMNQQGVLVTPVISSPEWKQAERLVRKGLLARGPSGRSYCIPGAFKREGGVAPRASELEPCKPIAGESSLARDKS